MRIAVVDLGTNTFHLLVAEIAGPGSWKTLYRERIFVNLASDGIAQISAAAMTRGLTTMLHFHEITQRHDVAKVIAVGTAALRQAANARDFLAQVKALTGITVEVISGDREAALIGKGVLSALPPVDAPLLIMDIGGGSVEMLLVQNGSVTFAASYPVGVAVLYANFHHTEPITPEILHTIDLHLEQVFADLHEALSHSGEVILVGASGTFEILEAILHPGNGEEIHYSTAPPADIAPIYREIVALDLEARRAHPAIPETRARYIVVAMHLIHYMLRHTSRRLLYISSFAMKEGLVAEHIERWPMHME